MLKRTAFILVAAVALVMVAGAASAQITVDPTAYVKGSGAIKVGDNLGLFDINVARVGTALIGGFRYREVATNATRPVCVIYSQRLQTLEVRGNFAKVTAVGFWNGVLSDLTVECLDQNPTGDWFHIKAVPKNSPLPVFYEAAGDVVKGDIAVWSQPTHSGYTKGYGTIATITNFVGRFQFWAEATSAGVRGRLNYVDYNPLSMSPVMRPRAVIYLPMVQHLAFFGNVAVFGGPGTLNGRPARIEVKVVDNAQGPGLAVRDEFYIKATPLTTDAVSTNVYEAGGPLTSGDIVVAPRNAP